MTPKLGCLKFYVLWYMNFKFVFVVLAAKFCLQALDQVHPSPPLLPASKSLYESNPPETGIDRNYKMPFHFSLCCPLIAVFECELNQPFLPFRQNMKIVQIAVMLGLCVLVSVAGELQVFSYNFMPINL